MPIYEYRCTNCGTLTEVRRTVAERNDPLDIAGEPFTSKDKNCNLHVWKRCIATPSNTPFEMLRDAGVFERLPGRHDYRGK